MHLRNWGGYRVTGPRVWDEMITIGFEVMPLHKQHKQGIELFVFVHDAQQVAGVLLSKDLTDDNRGETRVVRPMNLGTDAPIGRI